MLSSVNIDAYLILIVWHLEIGHTLHTPTLFIQHFGWFTNAVDTFKITLVCFFVVHPGCPIDSCYTTKQLKAIIYSNQTIRYQEPSTHEWQSHKIVKWEQKWKGDGQIIDFILVEG